MDRPTFSRNVTFENPIHPGSRRGAGDLSGRNSRLAAFAAVHSQLVPEDVVTILGSIPKQVRLAEADRRLTGNLTGNLTGLGIAAGIAFMLGCLGKTVFR